MLHKWCTCLKEPLLTNHETRKSNQKVAKKRTVSGRENNNNQNFRTKSANILSSVLCNVSRRHNPGTPVFAHFTSARRRYAPHDVAVKNKNKI